MSASKKALIIAPAWIGDAVMMQPLLSRLKSSEPQRQIDVLASPWVAALAERQPEVSEVIVHPFVHGQLALTARYHFAQRLRTRAYSETYILPNSLKSALIPWFARIPLRIGFTGEMRNGLLNRRHRLDKKALPQMAERFAKLAVLPEEALIRPLPPLHLNSSVAQQESALTALQLTRPTKLAVLCPGAEYGPAKRWPATHFAELAKKLGEAAYQVWLIGSRKDASIGAAIKTACGNPDFLHNVCGQTNLAQAIDLVALADVVVCNDSGLMHVSAALGRPLVALYGSSSPVFTPPLSSKATIIARELVCRPCFKRECPLGHLDCLRLITPEQVFNACLSTK